MSAIAVATTKFTAKDGYSSVVKKMQQATGSFVKKASAGFKQLNRNVAMLNNSLKPVNRSLNKITRYGAYGFTAAVGLAGVAIKKFTSEASKIEDATAAFTPLLGSTEKARKLVERLNKEAATTPFQFEGISNVAKQLLPVMNGSIEDTANTFRMLGDTAGGNMQKLETITRGYTKALLKGKPDMESLNMIAEAGVPIFTEMAKSMGISVPKLFELSKQSKLTTDDLTKTFKKMTNEGGIFFKGMDISSKTFSGVISTMKDNISLAFADIGMAMMPVLKEYAKKVTDVAKIARVWISENKALIKEKVAEYTKKIVSVLKSLYNIAKTVFTFITKHSSTILTIAKYFLVFIVVLKVITTILTVYTAIASAASIATLAIPLAIAAIIAAIVMLIIHWKEWSKAIDKFFDNAGMFGIILAPLEAIWEAIKGIVDIFKAFKADGFIGGLKQIGKTILSSVLFPLEKVLQALSAVGIAQGAYDSIKQYRNSLEFQDKPQPEAVNTKATQEQVRTERKEVNQNATVTINDNSGKAEMSEIPKGMSVILNNTSGNY